MTGSCILEMNILSIIIMHQFALALGSKSMWSVIEQSNKRIADQGPSQLQLSQGDILKSFDAPTPSQLVGPVTWHKRLWVTREIPYVIQRGGTSTQSASEVDAVIRKGMQTIEDNSCLQFRPKISSDTYWIEFYDDSGCFSAIGRHYFIPYSPTRISLGDMCVVESIVIHEILHALGFYHEQSRRDRDSFVVIYPDRIQSGMLSNFEMVEPAEMDTVGSPYDLNSVMHYDKTAFKTLAPGNTIESKFDPNMDLGGSTLSPTDIAELKELYQCSVTSGWSRWFGWSDCVNMGSAHRRSKVRFCVGKNTSLCPGADEFGTDSDVENCNFTGFIVNGQWNNWEAYGACSVTCDWGVQRRQRKCDNPPPSNGGRGCSGLPMQLSVCRNRRCASSTFDVDFDASFGSWTTTGRLGMQQVDGFTRRSGQGMTPNTGPRGDHPTGEGSYAVWPGVDGMFNSKAQLISPIVPAGSRRCLIFNYQLNGANINPTGALSAYVRETNGRILNLPFNLGGHQGNYWRRAAVDIPAATLSYQIYIEGSIGYDRHSDVAVDQIFLDERQCPNGLEKCDDFQSGCQGWSSVGECIKNPVWMTRECCASCSARGECRNDSILCGLWSLLGQCAMNPIWMWRSCCQSCQSAHNNCIDRDKSCEAWAQQGECTKNRFWMFRNCCKSCRGA